MLKYYWQEEWKLVDACCSSCVSVTYFDVTASVRDADFGGSIGKSATVSHTFRYSYISDTVSYICHEILLQHNQTQAQGIKPKVTSLRGQLTALSLWQGLAQAVSV